MYSFETMLTDRLSELGIHGELTTVIKNGIPCTGIKVINPENPVITPIVYYSADEAIDIVLARIMHAKDHGPDGIDLNILSDPEYLAEHLYVTVQRVSSDTDVLSRPCLNLELVMRVPIDLGDSDGSIKVTKALLDMADINADTAWQMAMDNTFKRLCVKSMGEILDLPEAFCDDVPFYVCTTESGNDGASALTFPEVFEEFCINHDADTVYILPSSTQEVLILPSDTVDTDSNCLAQMVEEINSSVVDPLIQLDPVVYRYDRGSLEICIAATATAWKGVRA